ncbi:regulatory signaling modulator protein AmpE [Oceanospirillum sanctuarii]|uniref:regulatory signaling modulator protein AmpE n=1 Tax=Oceanospirillum sanctuarii TaxID=1434821 RepID=UPI000A3CA78C|nr:regulatory signaling modulator protein AmpE [Oceanospirillum sanctuarii]
MEFVVLIIVLMLRSLLGLLPGRRHDRWFLALKAWAGRLFKPSAPHLYDSDEESEQLGNQSKASAINPTRWFSGTGAFVVAVVLPVAALSILMAILDDVIWGLPAFAVSILVLLYSLGRKDSAYWLTRFQIAWRQKDLQGAYQYAAEVLPEEAIKDEKQLYQRVFSRLVGISFQDFFLVTFWFMWLGAEGALLARLMILFCEKQPEEKGQESLQAITLSKIKSVQYLFEWLPAKLMGLSFMLTGHFVHCSQQWLTCLFNQKLSHEILLTRFALGALGEKVEDSAKEVLQAAQDNAHKDEQLQDLEALLRRSSVLWVIAIAVTVVLMEL